MKKNQLIVMGVVLLVLVIGIFGIIRLRGGTGQQGQNTQNVLPDSQVIPTVDSNTQVTLTSLTGNKDVILKVVHFPSGTKTIEYELSYNTTGNIPKGVAGSPVDVSGKDDFEKTLTLGTCSSGTCVYDMGVTKISVALTFSGSYGKQSFTKDFPMK